MAKNNKNNKKKWRIKADIRNISSSSHFWLRGKNYKGKNIKGCPIRFHDYGLVKWSFSLFFLSIQFGTSVTRENISKSQETHFENVSCKWDTLLLLFAPLWYLIICLKNADNFSKYWHRRLLKGMGLSCNILQALSSYIMLKQNSWINIFSFKQYLRLKNCALL